MSDLMRRATNAALRASGHGPTRAPQWDEADLADQFAAVLGLGLAPEEQSARFKRDTQGAPMVQRPTPHRLV